MSAAAEIATDATLTKNKGGKKMLVVIAALAVLLAGGGGAAAWVAKQKRDAAALAAEAEAEGDGEAEGAAEGRRAAPADGPRTPPAFLPLDNFVVNLADRESERFAQIGVTLELVDAKAADELKAYMPAIRNGILMLIAHKTSQELLTREGKEKLAAEMMRESVRPLGIAPPAKPNEPPGPVRNVHFSSFIIQ